MYYNILQILIKNHVIITEITMHQPNVSSPNRISKKKQKKKTNKTQVSIYH